MPNDLWDTSEPGGQDEDEFWNMFSADRLDELRSMITERMGVEPDWQPSRDLLNKLARKEARMKIMALWQNGDIDKLVELFKSSPASLDDTDVEAMWVVAEALAKAKQNSDALALYEAILRRNNRPQDRIATVQKAMGTLRMMDVERLIAMGNSSNGQSEFDVILIDITRARISAYLHDERIEEIPAQDWNAFQLYARQDEDPNQAGLCAWYLYKLKSYRDSLEYFKVSLEKGGDAMIAHGLAHALRQLGMKRETEEVAYAWRQPLINNSILFIDILETDLTKEIPPYIEPERLLRYGQVTMETTSGEGAQALAWYAYNSCQFEVAFQWFQRAVAWHPKEATVYGYALTLRRLKKGKEFTDLVNRYDGLFPKVVELIFPDNRYRPPTPCDMTVAHQRQILAGQTQQTPYAPQQPVYLGQPLVGQTQIPGQAQILGQQPLAAQQTLPSGRAPVVDPRNSAVVNDPTRQYAWGRVPQPQFANVAGGGVLSETEQMPKLNPKEFPISMYPENDLRYIASGQGVEPQQTAVPAGQYGREPFPGPWPLVARRVPGVGPMPYERFGFALLPGWNGITTATWPTTSAQIAPAGTLWALEPVGDEAAR